MFKSASDFSVVGYSRYVSDSVQTGWCPSCDDKLIIMLEYGLDSSRTHITIRIQSHSHNGAMIIYGITPVSTGIILPLSHKTGWGFTQAVVQSSTSSSVDCNTPRCQNASRSENTLFIACRSRHSLNRHREREVQGEEKWKRGDDGYWVGRRRQAETDGEVELRDGERVATRGGEKRYHVCERNARRAASAVDACDRWTNVRHVRTIRVGACLFVCLSVTNSNSVRL